MAKRNELDIKISVEWDGFLSQQFSEKKEYNDQYFPSLFLMGLIGRAAELCKDVSKKITEVSITESGYKVTIQIDRGD